MTKVVCLTGGIGSGKTLIANYFKSLGIPVYIADDEAKKLMKKTKIIPQNKNENKTDSQGNHATSGFPVCRFSAGLGSQLLCVSVFGAGLSLRCLAM